MKHLEFAHGIVAMADDNEYSPAAAFTGLSIATAAMLVDMATLSATEVDTTTLFNLAEQYTNALSKAIEFAKQQVENGSVESAIAEDSLISEN